MTKNERVKFIRELADNFLREVISRAHEMPDDWDGAELRQYMADHLAERYKVPHLMTGKRLREYRNTVLVRNL